MGFGLTSTRQLQNVLDHQIHPPRLIVNDLTETPVRNGQFLGFQQQLGGMTDGAQRVADLVGDTGGQSAQRGQFELLGLLGNLRQIIEKYQRMAMTAARQGDKARTQHRADCRSGNAARCHGRIGHPLTQALDQLRRVNIDDLAQQAFVAQQIQRALVGQQHLVFFVEHQNAGPHALQDQCVELFKVVDVSGAAFGDVFAELQPA